MPTVLLRLRSKYVSRPERFEKFLIPRELFSQALRSNLRDPASRRERRIQHFHNQVRIVGGTSHLIALIRAPGRQLNPPGVCGRYRRRQIIRQLACVSFRERMVAPRNQRALPQSERGMQRSRNSRNPSGRSRAGSKSGGAELTGTTRFEKGRGTFAGSGLLIAVAMVASRPFRQILTKARLGIAKAIRRPIG